MNTGIITHVLLQAAATPAECEQMEELLHKLRRTPHTIFSPPSTNHGAIRSPAVDNLNTGAVNGLSL